MDEIPAASPTDLSFEPPVSYRLTQAANWPRLVRNSQPVVRIEGFFAPGPRPREAPIDGGTQPGVNTKRLHGGWNYYFSDALRFSFRYARDFRSVGDRNVWSVESNEPRKFSERETYTAMQHMRVRANLTVAETEAIRRYLSQ